MCNLVYVIPKSFRLFLWSKNETYKTDQTNLCSVHIGLLPCAQQMAPHGGMCLWWRDDNWHPCFSLMGKQSSEDATKDREGRVKIRVISHAAFTWKKCVKNVLFYLLKTYSWMEIAQFFEFRWILSYVLIEPSYIYIDAFCTHLFFKQLNLSWF